MGNFDSAITVALALAVEEETDVPKRKRAKWSKEFELLLRTALCATFKKALNF